MVNEHLFIVRCTERNTQMYLFYFLFSAQGQELLKQNITGAAQGGLNAKKLKSIKIPLPPENIQKSIVKAVSTLEVKVNRALKGIEKQKKKIHELMSGLTSKEITLGDIATFKNGLNYSRKSKGDLVTIVGVKNFKEHFSPRLNELECIQIDGRLSSDYELLPDDILVVRSNGSANLVGRFLFIKEISGKTSFSGFTIRIRSKSEDIDTKFLCHYLRTDIVRERMTRDSKGSNIKSLNQGLLSSIKIPKLSLLEQQKIVKKIEKIESNIEKLENEIVLIPQQKEAVLKNFLE